LSKRDPQLKEGMEQGNGKRFRVNHLS